MRGVPFHLYSSVSFAREVDSLLQEELLFELRVYEEQQLQLQLQLQTTF